MSASVPESVLTTDQLLELGHFDRDFADILDEALVGSEAADATGIGINIEDHGAIANDVTAGLTNLAALNDAIARSIALEIYTVFTPAKRFYFDRAPGTTRSILFDGLKGIRFVGVPNKSEWRAVPNIAGTALLCRTFQITACRNLEIDGMIIDGGWGNALAKIGYLSHLVALPQTTIYFENVDDLPDAGRILVPTDAGIQTVTYTGKTGGIDPHLTGCSGGTGTMRLNNKCALFNRSVGSSTVALASNGVTLSATPQNITLISTASFPTSVQTGEARVYVSGTPSLIQWTGIAGNVLQGVTGTATLVGAGDGSGSVVQFVTGQGDQLATNAASIQDDPKNHGFVYGTDGETFTANKGITFRNCKLRNFYGDGVACYYSEDVKLIDTTIELCARNNVTLSNDAHGMTIDRCKLISAFATAIDSEPVEGPTSRVRVTNTTIEPWWDPASTINLVVTIQGGVVNRPAPWNYTSDWVITGCTIEGSIQVSCATDIHIHNNALTNKRSARAVVLVDQYCGDVWVDGNKIRAEGGNTAEANRGAITVLPYRFNDNSAGVPRQCHITKNVIEARDGMAGVWTGAVGGYQGFSGLSATGYTVPPGSGQNGVLAFSGTPFAGLPTNVLLGHKVLIGTSYACITANTNNTLTVAPVANVGVRCFFDAQGRTMADPSSFPVAAKVLPTGGWVHVEDNEVDCTADASAAGGSCYVFNTSSTWDEGYTDVRVSFKGNTGNGATGPGMIVSVQGGGDPSWLEVVDNKLYDNQATQTMTMGIQFVNANAWQFISFFGNEAPGFTLQKGLKEANYWFTGGSTPSTYAGNVDPEGFLFAEPTSLYHWLQASTLLMKGSAVDFDTGWAVVKTTPVPGIRGFSTLKGGTTALTWTTDEMPPSVLEDTEVLIVNDTAAGSDPGAASLSTPSRFVQLSSDVGFLGGVNYYHRCTLFTRTKRSTDVPPVVANAGARGLRAVIVALKDLTKVGSVVGGVVSANGSSNPGPSPVSVGGALVTDVNNALALNIVSWFSGIYGTADSFVNTDQAELSVQLQASTTAVDSNYPQIAIATGRVLDSGTTVNATTCTLSPNTYAVWAAFQIWFKPFEEPARATGTITCTTKANYVDGETHTIGDGMSIAKVYEFDVAGDGVTGGRVQVNISTDTTAAQVAARLRTAILANQPSLAVVDNADGSLALTHQWAGQGGNVTMSDTVTNVGHTHTGMSNGKG